MQLGLEYAKAGQKSAVHHGQTDRAALRSGPHSSRCEESPWTHCR